MEQMKIPTSRDIYLEVDGKKAAVIQSYQLNTERDNYSIEQFGSVYPVATIGGKTNYQLRLNRVVPLKSAIWDGIEFYDLSDFSVVIVKPDRKIIYSGCQWTKIQETAGLGTPCIETADLTASRRLVVE